MSIATPSAACAIVITLMKWVFGVVNLSHNEAKELIGELPVKIVVENNWLKAIENSNQLVWPDTRYVAKSFFLEEVK